VVKLDDTSWQCLVAQVCQFSYLLRFLAKAAVTLSAMATGSPLALSRWACSYEFKL
jgi:hypothetical protein